MFQKFIKRRKDRENEEYRIARNTVIFKDAVRWMGAYFPVLEHVEKLMTQDRCMTMGVRSEILEACGVGGLTLAQLIALNKCIYRTLENEGPWFFDATNYDTIRPIAYGKQIIDLFNVDVFNVKPSIPTITINVACQGDLVYVNRAVELFKRDTRINVATVVSPKIIVTYQPTKEGTAYRVETLNRTDIPNIFTL